MWLIMRGAMSSQIRCLHRDYYLPSMTGIAVALYENLATPSVELTADARAAHMQHMHHQLAGAEDLPGTYPFTLKTSVNKFRINKYLHQLIEPEFRARFLGDAAATFEEAGLTDVERRMIVERDWRAMIQYGVIFFLLEKLGAVIGVSNLHIYAAMRGESLETFRQTRNAPGALYSVAGTVNKEMAWNDGKAGT